MKLKVYGGLTMGLRIADRRSAQARTIVCARNKKRAVELLNEAKRNISLHHFNGYWCETGNYQELETACEEGVWVDEGLHAKIFRRVV